MQDLINIIGKGFSHMSLWSVLDILVVSYIFYKGYMLIKETRAEQLLKGMILLIVLIPISYLLKLDMLYFILNKTLTIGVLSIVIIFQPEIRRALEHIGRTAFDDMHVIQDEEVLQKIMSEITYAVGNLAETKTGALIVIEQSTGLNEIISSGTLIDANITSNLLENIFVVNTPLHDGATIIRNDRIVASGCVLPLTNNNTINKKNCFAICGTVLFLCMAVFILKEMSSYSLENVTSIFPLEVVMFNCCSPLLKLSGRLLVPLEV